MYLQKCEHPKRIWNKYTKEFIYVPCGKCNSCLRQKSTRWVERLNVEAKCWKYQVFFTLTYDPEHLPVLTKIVDTQDTKFLADLTHKHCAPGENDVIIDYNQDVLAKFDRQSIEYKNALDFWHSMDKFNYLSVYDCQCFLKRLRKHLTQLLTKYFKNDYGTKDQVIRYYLVGEYGNFTKRSHYHGLLFFSSEKEAAVIEEALRNAWKFGIVDSSFVSNSASAYVAKYVNCLADLPAVYCNDKIRPFSLFSKQPPIGTLYFSTEEVRKIFNNASPTMFVDYLADLKIHDVPLWRTYIDSLFPKIPLYGKVSHYDRTLLYKSVFVFNTAFGDNYSVGDIAFRLLTEFSRNEKRFSPFYLHCYDEYINALRDNLNDDKKLLNSIIRWLSKSARVVNQSQAFGISIDDYVKQIELYYDNCDKEKLSLQYRFMDEFSNKYDTVVPLLAIDRIFLESIIDVDLCDMSAEELTILEGYGVDMEKFTSPDLSIREQYRSQLIPENTIDYWIMMTDAGVWSQKACKKKKMNDYLQSHPDLLKPFEPYIPDIKRDGLGQPLYDHNISF